MCRGRCCEFTACTLLYGWKRHDAMGLLICGVCRWRRGAAAADRRVWEVQVTAVDQERFK